MTVKKVFADYFNFRIIACSLSAACIDAILNSWVYINVRGTCLIAKTANIYTLEIYTLYKWVRVRVRDSSFMHYIIMQMKILIASIYFVSDATNHLDDIIIIIITQITAINLPTTTQQCMCWGGEGLRFSIIAVFLVLCRSVLYFSFAVTFTTSDRTQKGIGMKLKRRMDKRRKTDSPPKPNKDQEPGTQKGKRSEQSETRGTVRFV